MAEMREMMDYLEEYANLDYADILPFLVQKEKEEMAEESDDEDQVQISEIQGKDESALVILLLTGFEIFSSHNLNLPIKILQYGRILIRYSILYCDWLIKTMRAKNIEL